MNLDEIERKWLRQCPSCDAGLPAECAHPGEDYRPVILDLVKHIREQERNWSLLLAAVIRDYGTLSRVNGSRRIIIPNATLEEVQPFAVVREDDVLCDRIIFRIEGDR